MALRNIIIESNRLNSVRELEQSRLSQRETLDTLAEELPNNTWTTTVESGILVEAGDTIRLESAVVQELGSGSDVIELKGTSGNIIQDAPGINPVYVGEVLSDNGVELELGYYITNRQQFNFNLPKDRFQTDYNFKSNGYGGPAFYENTINVTSPFVTDTFGGRSWARFERCYPYQYIEGTTSRLNLPLASRYNFIPANNVPPPVPPAYTPTLTNLYNPSNSKPHPDMYSPSSIRNYIGSKEYSGPYQNCAPAGNGSSGGYSDYNSQAFNTPVYDLTTPWNYFSSTVKLEVETGFSTPAAIAETLTSQLHARQGDADAWAVEEFPAEAFDPASSNPKSGREIPFPTVTDETYRNFPSSTGKMLGRRTDGSRTHPDGNSVGAPFRKPTLDELAADRWCSVFTSKALTTSATLENPNAYRGEYYSRFQGQQLYYSYLMTAKPKYVKTMSALNLYAQSYPQMDAPTNNPPANAPYSIWTAINSAEAGNLPVSNWESYTPERGDVPAHAYQVGAIGNNIVILNKIRQKLNGHDFTYYKNRTNANVTDVAGTISLACPERDDIIVTNLLWSDTAMEKLGPIFDNYFDVIYPTTNTDIKSDDFLDAHIMKMNWGRLDDQLTFPGPPEGLEGRKIGTPPNDQQSFLACPHNIWDDRWIGVDPTLNYKDRCGSSYEIASNSEGKAPAGDTTPGGNIKQFNSMVGSLNSNGNEVYMRHYLNSKFTAYNAWYGILPNENSAYFVWKPPATFRNGAYNTFEKFKVLWDSIPVVSGGGRLAIVPQFVDPARFDGGGSDLPYYGPGSSDEIFVAFIYEDRPWYGAVTDAEKDKLLYPWPMRTEFFGMSPSELTCQYSQIVTTQKTLSTNGIQVISQQSQVPLNRGEAGQYPTPMPLFPASPVPDSFYATLANIFATVTPEYYMGYVSVGSNDASIFFDTTLSRFSFRKFHTPIKKGNGPFAAPNLIQESNPEQNIISWQEQQAHLCPRKYGPYTSAPYVVGFEDMVARVITQPSLSAQAGIGIVGFGIICNTGQGLANNLVFPLSTFKSLYFNNTLLSKLGFDFEQLLPKYGRSQNQFNRGNANKYLGFGEGTNILKKYENMVSPFTTEAYISAAISIGLSRQTKAVVVEVEGADPDVTYVFAPAENLGGTISGVTVNTNATSDELVALNLPRKLDGSYLVVYSNIVRAPVYYGGFGSHGRLPCIGYLLKNYSSGDYFYSFQSTIEYVADKDYVLTDILVDIRNPDSSPARIGPENSLMFKIQKRQAMPALPPPPKEK